MAQKNVSDFINAYDNITILSGVGHPHDANQYLKTHNLTLTQVEPITKKLLVDNLLCTVSNVKMQQTNDEDRWFCLRFEANEEDDILLIYDTLKKMQYSNTAGAKGGTTLLIAAHPFGTKERGVKNRWGNYYIWCDRYVRWDFDNARLRDDIKMEEFVNPLTSCYNISVYNPFKFDDGEVVLFSELPDHLQSLIRDYMEFKNT